MTAVEARLHSAQHAKLVASIAAKDEATIRRLVRSGIPDLLNRPSPDAAYSALGLAAYNNDTSTMQLLFELGAHPDVRDPAGRTPAMNAVQLAHTEALAALIERGADLAVADKSGQGVLFFCVPTASSRHERCLQMALHNGADVNNVRGDGRPAFHEVCEKAPETFAWQMLSLGMNVGIKDEKTERTALMSASSADRRDVVQSLLLGGADPNAVTQRSKRTALHCAAISGSVDALKMLAGFGTAFGARDSSDNSALHLAALHGQPTVLKFLAQRGCDPKLKNGAGQTGRTLAKLSGRKSLLKEFRRAEKAAGQSGWMFDGWAVALYDFLMARGRHLRQDFSRIDESESGRVSRSDLLDLLRKWNAPLPEEPQELKQLLSCHDVDRQGSISYEELLSGKLYLHKQYHWSAFDPKKKKKKKKTKSKKGKSKAKKLVIPLQICERNPLQLARTQRGNPPDGYIEKVELRADPVRFHRDNQPLHPLQDDSAWYMPEERSSFVAITDAVRNDDLQSLRSFVSCAGKADTKDKFYKTPLMVACLLGRLPFVRFLLANGASVTARDGYRWTPLHFACEAGMTDVAELLLESGAPLESTTRSGATPLMLAVQSSNFQLVDLLLQKGAKLRAENVAEQSVMDVATDWADPAVYDQVKVKWDKLPPVKDKRANKKNKSATSATSASRKASRGSSARVPSARTTCLEQLEPLEPTLLARARAALEFSRQRDSAAAMASGRWVCVANSRQLIANRVGDRRRFGWTYDFGDYRTPQLENADRRLKQLPLDQL